MPLTLEMRNVSGETTRLVVDRNNLLFIFPFNSDSRDERKIAYDRNKKFDADCKLFVDETYDGYKGKILDAKHPLHPNLYHTCEKDRDTFHYHFCYEENVDYNKLNELFEKFPESVLSEMISSESLKEVLLTCKKYFMELENNPRAQKIEKEFRDIKRDHFIAEKNRLERMREQLSKPIKSSPRSNNALFPNHSNHQQAHFQQAKEEQNKERNENRAIFKKRKL